MFSDRIETLRSELPLFVDIIENATAEDVRRVLSKGKIGLNDFAVLLSRTAHDHFIEELAQRAKYETKKRFGNTMKLYVPLYVSDHCTNCCSYCSFSAVNRIDRHHLKFEDAKKEIDFLAKKGFKSLLLVAGEEKKIVNISYLSDIISYAKTKFSSVSIEIAPLEEDEYRQLVNVGLDASTIFQETYNRERYMMYHRGTKRNYIKRMDYIDYMAKAGVRRIGIGALLGLSEVNEEVFFQFHHIKYILSTYWQTSVSLAFPRLRPMIGGFQPNDIVEDKRLVQIISAFRIAFNQIDLVLSTRESASFRDNMLGIGITQISAGSKTTIGGYLEEDEADFSQFEIADDRTVEEVVAELKQRGFDPVWKDWEGVMYDTIHV